MLPITSYQIYLSGLLTSPQMSGNIDSDNHVITMAAAGGAAIDISLAGLQDGGQPVTYQLSKPIAFVDKLGVEIPQPGFISWVLLSPLTILITNLNYNSHRTHFVLRFETSDHQVVASNTVGFDPTIVNTYVPPPQDVVPEAAPSPAPALRVVAGRR
jgi:hypothetical protein